MLEGSNGLPKDVVEPPKFITAKHVSAIFEKLGFDASCGQKVFGVLCEALSRSLDETVMEGGEEEEDDNMVMRQSESNVTREGFSVKSVNSGSDMRASEADSGGGGGPISQRMDVKAFIRAAEMDDILLQVSRGVCCVACVCLFSIDSWCTILLLFNGC